MKNLIFMLGFCMAVPVVPQHDSYCVADGFTGKTAATCSDGNPLITESDLLNNGYTFLHKYKSSAIITSSPIRASYLALGTANDFTKFPELFYTGSTIDRNTPGISLDNGGKDAFNYFNKSSLNDIAYILVKRIQTIVSLGANSIRFDELDTCTSVECFENFTYVMQHVFDYMANNTISAIGNNNSNKFKDFPSFPRLLIQKQVKIVAWIVESR